MLARNSDLYLEVRASCSAFSSSARLACSTSRFLRSTSFFCSSSKRAFTTSSSLVCCSTCCWRSEEHTSELQSLAYLVCRLLLEKKNTPDVSSPDTPTPLPLRVFTTCT